MKKLLKRCFCALTFTLVVVIAFPQSNILAQNQLKIFEDPGGGSQPTQGSNSTDNTFIYVAGGLLVAGIIAYALLTKKDKSEGSDTTNVSLVTDQIIKIPKDYNSDIERAKEKIPVDIFFGIRNDDAIRRGKTYMLGVSLKL
ncbi:MAG: hypothetical protein KJN64_07075 [Ignavibacteria bacterium]|nr:hypothetical protein [Ignavibacteria bacterium]MBT8383689.1 hypothetical protein [Ignavibacteria bacterium]MBT8391130.1 hypothetical protein [Ignavibacteria bacterium]NNJ52991.1 hypothetical protein [Ignavibacteriaceae bacterium]NNL20007.1 hypothetical protein [Ignavibacteriaceae bacterium]